MAKIQKREILPSDLWQIRAIITGGVDTDIYKEDITHYWGNVPYENYVSTESIILAAQSWNKKWMTFFPDGAFYEFIPIAKRSKDKANMNNQPSTVLLNEVRPGQEYEVVITHLYGMPFLRYRMQDVVEFVALQDEEAGIYLPQMVFKYRIGDILYLAGMAQLDERTIWKAISNTGIKYEDWLAFKEYDIHQSYLRLYIELKEEKECSEIEHLIDAQLSTIDVDYRDLHSWLSIDPLRVTLLSPGTFQRYYAEKRKEGADLAHMKPPHMNAPQDIRQRILQLSEVAQ
jgi:hypothetical protein